MQGCNAPDNQRQRALQKGFAAIRLGLSSDLGSLHAFIVNTCERGRDASKFIRIDSHSGAEDGSALQKWASNASSKDQVNFSPVSSPPDSPSSERSFVMPHSSRWSPHSPRSVLQTVIPDSVSQRASMEMIMLQARPTHSDIKRMSWNGCSRQTRAQVWRMLFRSEPLLYSERETGLTERRQQYAKLQHVMGGPCVGCICIDKQERTDFSLGMLRQIDMDLPRTHPNVPLFHIDRVRSAMRRILYLFAVVHPDSGYVQGMNEILTPLMAVFLSENVAVGSQQRKLEAFLELESLDKVLSEEEVANAEADAYWCFVELVSSVFDNYTAEQPGMHRSMSQLQTLLSKVDPPLLAHLSREDCHPMQFAFRWVAALMLREFSLPLVVHMWDGLLSQNDGFGSFLVYFAAAMVVNWRDELLAMEFAEIIVLLLHLPTGGWSRLDIDYLLAQAQVWSAEHSLESDQDTL